MTVAIPVYKRLRFLPNALACVARQSYHAIELVVSDNGENLDVVPALVVRHYDRRFVFRTPVVSDSPRVCRRFIARAACCGAFLRTTCVTTSGRDAPSVRNLSTMVAQE